MKCDPGGLRISRSDVLIPDRSCHPGINEEPTRRSTRLDGTLCSDPACLQETLRCRSELWAGTADAILPDDCSLGD